MPKLTKPINRITIIKETQKFVREFNKNKVKKEFLESCEKANRLFSNKQEKN